MRVVDGKVQKLLAGLNRWIYFCRSWLVRINVALALFACVLFAIGQQPRDPTPPTSLGEYRLEAERIGEEFRRRWDMALTSHKTWDYAGLRRGVDADILPSPYEVSSGRALIAHYQFAFAQHEAKLTFLFVLGIVGAAVARLPRNFGPMAASALLLPPLLSTEPGSGLLSGGQFHFHELYLFLIPQFLLALAALFPTIRRTLLMDEIERRGDGRFLLWFGGALTIGGGIVSWLLVTGQMGVSRLNMMKGAPLIILVVGVMLFVVGLRDMKAERSASKRRQQNPTDHRGRS